LTPYTRPTYAPTGYVAPGQRPALAGTPPARPGAPAPPATGRPGQPTRPTGQRPRPGQRQKGHQIRSQLQTISTPQAQAGPPPVTRTISLAEGMTVKDLADKLDVKVKDVLRKLLEKRLMMTINSTVDSDTAMMIAREFGAEIQMRSFEEELVEHQAEISRPEDLVERAPVVTVMGHVDHGKTTLLDAIRETRVAEREAGGITQHIGAYAVDVSKRKVVFLDTPGHEAFTMMRARGARVTDVVILVVAADDGVMPQTKEAIDHARAANVPILVAINKIDKPNANPERVKKELSDLGLMPEEWGGKTVTVPVSAKKRENIDGLLEMILLVTEMSELKANPKRDASGTVLEAKLDRGRGSVATVLVQDGTLKVGDTFIAGPIVSKVRALIDDRGRNVRGAAPSTPVEVLGLEGLPSPGDTFQVINDPAKARQIAMYRQLKEKERSVVRAPRTLEDIQKQLKEGSLKELALIIKADVGGSAEVLADTLQKLSDEQVKIRIILSGVGAINESDVQLALASNAIIIGFNVRPSRDAADMADREHVDIRLHSVIYNVTDEMRKAMSGLLEPTFKEARLGQAEIRQIFKVPKVGTVAGCMVIDGALKRSGGAQARLVRDGKVVHEGPLGSLKRFKDDVSEVKTGFECGLSFERYNDLKLGDIVEVFVVERIEAPVS
jgi:translation initiation factor IF-2